MKYIPVWLIIWLLIVEEHVAYVPPPYLVRIFKHSTSFRCNGILITKNLVLTSAHCVDWKGGNVSLYLGYKKIQLLKLLATKRQASALPVVFFYTSIILRTKKKSGLYANNDIALIKLPKNSILNDNVQLSNISGISTQKYANLTGYLHYKAESVEMVIQNEDVCAEAIAYYDKDQHGCVMLPRNARYASYWGFGSPLSIYNNTVGFTTYGTSIPSSYVLFVDIEMYKAWISFHINHNPPYSSAGEIMSRNFSLFSVLVTLLLLMIK